MQKATTNLTDALEFLDANDIIDAIDGHGLNDLVHVELSDGLGALLASFLGLLKGNKLVALQGNASGNFKSVGSSLLELLANLKLELHVLKRSAGLDCPDVAFLGDLHDRRGDSGSFPQQEVDVQGLKEVVVLIGGDALVLANKGVNGESDGYSTNGKMTDKLKLQIVRVQQFIQLNT
jgi:hypothetical protein